MNDLRFDRITKRGYVSGMDAIKALDEQMIRMRVNIQAVEALTARLTSRIASLTAGSRCVFEPSLFNPIGLIEASRDLMNYGPVSSDDPELLHEAGKALAGNAKKC